MATTMGKVLFVSSAHDLQLDSFAEELTPYSMELHRAANIEAAREWMVQSGIPHLLLVDLSDADGMEFVSELTDSIGLPIITIASHEGTTTEALEALKYADDFIRRQYAIGEELALRIRRVLSRMANFNYATGPKIKITDWLSVDLLNQQAKFHDEIRKLTPTENALLGVLLTHRGQTVDAETLISRVWRLDPGLKDRNALRVHMHRLRNKLEADPDHPAFIMTVRGIGYSFAEASAES